MLLTHWNNALGIHAQAINVHAKRAELIASNLANADTPNYKARDIDFKGILNSIAENQDNKHMRTTSSGHVNMNTSIGMGVNDVMYRTPHQDSLDGNTVEGDQENVRYTQTALHYQASIRFLGDRIKGLKSAIKGQ
jgi:flagellar basal-body rod protein FlgB